MKTLSDNFKRIFLIKFTEELIRNSEKVEIKKLQEIITSKEQGTFVPKKEEINLEETLKEEKKSIAKINHPRRQTLTKPITRMQVREIRKPYLLTPEPKLPEHLEYLKPIPTTTEIDLLKLDPLIKDRAVKTIEVNPNEKVIVTGNMGTKPTNIVLNKEEIDQIIDKFSQKAKIPIEEGVYKVVVGNLILSAIVSEMIGSKFLIRKIPAQVPKAPPVQTRPQLFQKVSPTPINQRNNQMFPPQKMPPRY